jgi:hypothetical protein
VTVVHVKPMPISRSRNTFFFSFQSELTRFQQVAISNDKSVRDRTNSSFLNVIKSAVLGKRPSDVTHEDVFHARSTFKDQTGTPI